MVVVSFTLPEALAVKWAAQEKKMKVDSDDPNWAWLSSAINKLNRVIKTI